MSQIILRNITISFGRLPLIEEGNLTIERGEKVCLIGRNGAGKTTLLKMLNGDIVPDKGTIEKDGGVKFGFMTQDIPSIQHKTVFEVAAEPLIKQGLEDWEVQYRVEKQLTKLQLDPEKFFDDLSGGLKRRALLAAALVNEPDVLLLDEPTNHLDIESITWLDQFLKNYHKTVIFVTHDRMLMQSIGTHIVEVDYGRLISWHGEYEAYLKHKEFLLDSEEKENKLFDKKLANEEVWIRQGIKARRTRNEGRVRALEKMREERKNRRVRSGNVNLTQHDIERSGKIVFDVENISYGYDGTPIISDFSTVIQRGDKIGIIGPNGSGKSTLLNLLLGKLQPKSGVIKTGTNIQVAYFDQKQIELDDTKSVQDNVGMGSSSVTIGGQQKHIMSYLQDFLFSPDRVRSPLKMLSGGEKNRVMLAKLFLKPCNVLVLDEPTNDLDVETLELLEEQLMNFSGTILVVSHDRAFLNNIITSTIVMEGNGQVGEYIGGYDDWIRQRRQEPINTALIQEKGSKTQEKSTDVKPKSKLSFKEKRELDQITVRIETLESELKQLHEHLADPVFYKEHVDKIVDYQKRITEIETELETAIARWEQLEKINNG